ncbi:MAG: hypothetical protein KAJ07_04540 [Planctomycetes bacterium]|nr:hypothetical protein [Planctomycetota bacterium]
MTTVGKLMLKVANRQKAVHTKIEALMLDSLDVGDPETPKAENKSTYKICAYCGNDAAPHIQGNCHGCGSGREKIEDREKEILHQAAPRQCETMSHMSTGGYNVIINNKINQDDFIDAMRHALDE